MCEDDQIRDFLRDVLTDGPDRFLDPAVSIVANLVDKDRQLFMDRQTLLEGSGVRAALERLAAPGSRPVSENVKDALEGFSTDIIS